MGLHKIRRKAVLAGAMTVAGSVGLSGRVNFSGQIAMATGSASAQKAGILRINSGATSATASTTAINSGAFVMISPVLLGTGVASFNLIGQIVVTTVAQAASGGYFSLGYTGTQNGLAANVDVGWFIINPA
jgi:hypothetical protein